MLTVTIAPTIILLLQRRIVNHLDAALNVGGTDVWTFAIIAIFAVLAILQAVSSLGETLQGYLADQLQDLVATDAIERLLHHVGDWHSLDLHEDAKALDTLTLAMSGVKGYRDLTWSMFATITAVVGIVPLSIALGSVAWWIPIIVVLAVGPGFWMSMRIYRREWEERTRLAQDERRRDIRYNVITSAEYARDVRLFDLLPTQIKTWRQLAIPILNAVVNLRLSLLRRVAPWVTLFGFLVVVPLIWMMNNTVSGHGTMGDFVLVIGSLAAMHNLVVFLASNTGNVGSATTGVQKYLDFMHLEPPQLRGSSSNTELLGLKCALTVHDINFSYPGADKPMLSDFTLEVKAGERIAIVGENGAGKTTLTRLVTRLFDVEEGDIRWDDMSIYDVNPLMLRRKLAVIPQDFARFPFTLRENIALGRIDTPPSDEEIERVLTEVGLGELLTLNDNPLDTPLTKELDGGTQLSGGQWQRIAIARAMIRADQADIIIMDEPTASVDPLAEVDITRRMLHMAHGKTAIVISHRLGICTLVDRVLVMENGRIVEDGSHASLLAANGVYAEMFRAQSSWYQGDA